MDNESLNNSMVSPEQNPLVIQHTKVLQALKSVESIIIRADGYALDKNQVNSSNTKTARNTLFVIHELNIVALEILKEVLED